MRPWARRTLGPFWLLAGTLHFTHTLIYERIMPPWLPRHRDLVLLSGAAELAGGAAALSGRAPRFTRWWITAVLISVFPANVHMALHPEQVRGLRVPRPLLWARLPLQALFVAWAWAGTR